MYNLRAKRGELVMNTLQKVFKHLSLISRHKWVVFKLCCKVGEAKRGLLHDLSKYSWTEFSESVKYYNGSHSPITECKKVNGYSKAWLHHKGRNRHHAEYWYDSSAPEPMPIMPYKYVAEMLCDKMAAGMIYQGEKWSHSSNALFPMLVTPAGILLDLHPRINVLLPVSIIALQLSLLS